MHELGADIKLANNFPWVYIDKINGKKVTEKFRGDHGFTLAFLPITKDQEIQFTDLLEVYRLIIKYK